MCALFVTDAHFMHNFFPTLGDLIMYNYWNVMKAKPPQKKKKEKSITPKHTELCQGMLFGEEYKVISSVCSLSWYAHLSEMIWTHTYTFSAGYLFNIKTNRDKWPWAENHLCHVCSLVSQFTGTSSNICNWLWSLISCCFCPCSQRWDSGQVCSHRWRNHKSLPKKVLSHLSFQFFVQH